jgi:hypothetical protein
MAAWMKCSVLSLKISDIGGTRHADEIQHQTPNLVVHVFTMRPDIQISCLSASNDFDPTIIMHFLINSRYDAMSDIFSWITRFVSVRLHETEHLAEAF